MENGAGGIAFASRIDDLGESTYGIESMLDKFAIAKALEEFAALLELEGGDNVFRARAYRRGAGALIASAEEPADLIRERRLTDIPGIGRAIASAVGELAETGRLSQLEELRTNVPPGAA